VILADGPGGLIYARSCPGRLSRRWYAKPSGSIGQERSGGRSLGLSPPPYIPADLRAPVLGGEREPGAGLPRMQGPCPAVQRQPGHADPARLGRPAGRRAGICGAQSLYIKVRSVSCDQAEPARAQQVAVARPADPAGLYRPDNLACRPGAVRGPARASRHRRRRCRSRGLQRSGGAGSHESRDMGPARHGRWRTVSRPAARPSRPARGVLPGA